jgi:arylsulfatase A-like enzyme
MKPTKSIRNIDYIRFAFLGGLWGGFFTGLGEAFIKVFTQELHGASIFFFGLLYYGLFGALLGLLLGLLVFLYATFTGKKPLATNFVLVTSGLFFAVMFTWILHATLFKSLVPIDPLSRWGYVSFALEAMILYGLFIFLSRLISRKVLGSFSLDFESSLGLYIFLLLLTGTVAVCPFFSGGENLKADDSYIPQSDKGSNVILILVEALRYDRPGIYRGPAKTPNLRGLARQGILFENMVAQAYWIRPSVASYLTSLYPFSHGVLTGLQILPEGLITLPEILQQKGYLTAGIINNPNLSESFNFQQGFDYYRYLRPREVLWATEDAIYLKIYPRLREWYLRNFLRREVVDFYYRDAEFTTQEAISWLERSSSRKFFLLLDYRDPCFPYFFHPYNGKAISSLILDPEKRDFYLQAYDSEIEYLDASLGHLFEYLQQRNLYDNTMIVLASTGGEEFYEHLGWGQYATAYEELVHIPLIIKLPGGKRGGMVFEQMARAVDIPPTILTQLGLEVPIWMQGADLFDPDRNQAFAFVEGSLGNLKVAAIRDKRWKLVRADRGNHRNLPEVALYDLENDPGELVNLARQSEYEAIQDSLEQVQNAHIGYPKTE